MARLRTLLRIDAKRSRPELSQGIWIFRDMHKLFQPYKGLPLAPLIVASLMLIVGALVIGGWHLPNLLAIVYPYSTLMAYNTALGFIACGIGLLALLKAKRSRVVICAVMLFTIGAATLVDLLSDINLNTTDWFVIMLSEPPARSQPISPITSISFILASAALMFSLAARGNRTIVATLLCVLIIFIAVAAVLGQGFGVLPSYIWLGIKMAPQTVVGLVAFAAAIIYLRYQAAITAFNRLNFFNRLSTGFIFMSLLFIGIGSIAMLQISSVASISQKLYSGPLQISNAALRIKADVGQLNRRIKDIAVDPSLAQEHKLPELIGLTTTQFFNEVTLLEQIHRNSNDIADLRQLFTHWQTLLQQINNHLLTGNITAYRAVALTESQNTTIKLEQQCDLIVLHAQQQIHSLNEQAITTKNHAANLMQVVILGFLLVGIIVAALITRSLSWQLQKIRAAMLQLAEGHTQIEIPFLDHPQDIGDMAKTLAVFAQNIDERNSTTELLARHQQDLEKINAQLAQTNKELETFAYVASHDLKSPLRGIAQLSTWIEEDLAEQQFAEVNKHTVMLRNRIQRMEKLLDDLLIFYRAGKTDGNLVEVDVAHMTRELFEIHNNKPGLQLILAPDLPHFKTLATPFEQILRNLLSNAIKHHDRPEGTIRLSAKTLPNHFYEFSLCDDGPGIPEKFQQRVFGMFQTLKPRDELEGSGMGLALIKKIVDTYGGAIAVQSEGRGCCFTFSWPSQIKMGK